MKNEKLLALAGLEPAASGLKVHHTSDCASEECGFRYVYCCKDTMYWIVDFFVSASPNENDNSEYTVLI